MGSMSTAVRVVLEWTVLRCHGPHPYAKRLASRFGGTLHDVPVFTVPFRCEATGNVWRRVDAPAAPVPNGRPLIYARCSCGAVTEYEVVPHAE